MVVDGAVAMAAMSAEPTEGAWVELMVAMTVEVGRVEAELVACLVVREVVKLVAMMAEAMDNFADDSSAMADGGHSLQMYFSAVYVTAVALELDVNIPAADGLTWTEVGCDTALRGFVEVGDAKLVGRGHPRGARG